MKFWLIPNTIILHGEREELDQMVQTGTFINPFTSELLK